MFNETFWVAVAFVLFFVLFGKKIWVGLTGKLDERSDRIRGELEDAVRLREEAQELLANCQRQQREASQEADRLIEHARAEAERVALEAETKLAEQLARREQLAKEKIAQAETRAIEDIRHHAIDLAITATADVIAGNLDDSSADALVDKAISGLEERLG
jgi:F-type H+-transporting ATPase subunit b